MTFHFPSGSFNAAVARTPFDAAMQDAFAAIDASKVTQSRLAALSLQAAEIADAEVGPRSTDAAKAPSVDPEGFVARLRHGAAWNAVYRREARRLFGGVK